MFNNLIESSSHRSELKRRGSFFLFTTASYALLFVVAGVASIYAYDARLEQRDLELVTMMSPVEFPAAMPPQSTDHQPPPNHERNERNFDERETAMASVNRPDVQPIAISTVPNKNQPIREGVTTFITGRDRNAEFVGGPSGIGAGPGRVTIPPTTIEIVTPPPPSPEQKPKPAVVSKGVITSEALTLPKPLYPQMARMMRLQGKVSVQVLIDEHGKVVSARAIDGHPLFKQVSETAAYQARFSPTKLGDQPVKVSGVITYNFVLQ
jgi:TonB family protein